MRQAIRAALTLATAVSTVAALAAGLPGAAATTTYTITDLGGRPHQLLTPDLRKVLR